MSQEKLQTMSMQNFGGVKEVHYGIVQVVNYCKIMTHLNNKCNLRFMATIGHADEAILNKNIQV